VIPLGAASAERLAALPCIAGARRNEHRCHHAPALPSLPDRGQDDRDVVGAAARIGGVDEGSAGLVHLGAVVAEDGAELGVVERVG
jgi:hypothetical protein